MKSRCLSPASRARRDGSRADRHGYVICRAPGGGTRVSCLTQVQARRLHRPGVAGLYDPSAMGSQRPTLCVRAAVAADAPACAAIYAPYVADTAITFESQAPSAAEMQQRIEAASRSHAWFVLQDGGRVVGYAYGGPFNRRAAYRWSCEVSVYVELGRRRTGAGRALYQELL